MKVLSVVGARPQFVKAAAVSPVLRDVAVEILVHTGQHYDPNMSRVFFEELRLPQPDYNLEVGSGSHAWQTARMMEALEEVMLKEEPDFVLVYGDTNSTLAGSLTSAKMRITTAHVEAGLRSFNRAMPEEINRVLVDHSSDLLFAPTANAISNLAREGLADRARLTGDVMADMMRQVLPIVRARASEVSRLGVQPRAYVLLTLHRPSNVDDPVRLRAILGVMARLGESVLFPVHPRTAGRIREFGLGGLVSVHPFKLVDPLGYTGMLLAEAGAKAIVTDSGGVQKEAYLLAIPCVTLRSETEWCETVTAGWNVLVDPAQGCLENAVLRPRPASHPPVFGNGHAAERIVEQLTSYWQVEGGLRPETRL